MRRLARTGAAPAVLTDPDGPAAKEKTKARAHFKKNPQKPFSFKAYKHDDVKSALESIFNKKCAYCESPYAATAPVDVEHYRPKGKVREHPPHNGYWWLAMEWGNLLPSCIDCNRERRQVTVAPGMTINEIRQLRTRRSTPVAGKQHSFNTADSIWVTQEGAVDAEQPLLLDPTIDDPDDHLRWSLDRSIPLVVEKNDSPRGLESIKVYGLNRLDLVQARIALLDGLRVARADIVDILTVAAETADPASKSGLIEIATRMADGLRANCDTKKPYSAMVVAFVQEFEVELSQLL